MKLTALKNIIKEEITKLREQNYPVGPGLPGTMNPNPNQYMTVPSSYFNTTSITSLHPEFDHLAWAQNFQTTKIPTVANPCNFLNNQMGRLQTRMDPIINAAINAAGASYLTTQINNQLRQSNKHYDRMATKAAMMQAMMFQNNCPQITSQITSYTA